MLELIKSSALLLFVISAVNCENCVTYDFGANFNNSFNFGNGLCNGMADWGIGEYSELNIEGPHADSSLFISPGETLSCVSSYSFEMRARGVLEVHVYMESVSESDQVVVLAQEFSAQDSVVTGTFMVTPLSATYVNGWHVLRINLFGNGNFNGFITFLGQAAPGSTVLVDSFRYIPPEYEGECYLYDEDFVPPTPPPQIQPDPQDCVAYDFEDNFEDMFNSDRGLCTSFSQWSRKTYEEKGIESPTAESLNFISPQSQISCTSSFVFNAQAGGVIEVNVYMESKSTTDQIAVLANHMYDLNSDGVTGSHVLTPMHEGYSDGWQTLRIELGGTDTYTAYISFIGMADEDSIVLIDSFRYIPPTLDAEVCKIYDEELFQTTTPVPTTTPTPSGTECITVNFEDNFNDDFVTSTQQCSGFSAWNLGSYYSSDIESIFPESSTFISPNVSSSCISSFVFEMKPAGVVEVNVFMRSLSDLDYLIILVNKVVPGGIDTVAGFELYYASNADFVEGWNTLRVSINDFTAFNGYITLIGSTAEDSIVLIDSFRYIPPNSEDPCEIY